MVVGGGGGPEEFAGKGAGAGEACAAFIVPSAATAPNNPAIFFSMYSSKMRIARNATSSYREGSLVTLRPMKDRSLILNRG